MSTRVNDVTITLTLKLRGLADRLEAAEAARTAALIELVALAADASALVADEGQLEDGSPVEPAPSPAVPQEERRGGVDDASAVGAPAPPPHTARSMLPAKDRAALRSWPPQACPDCERTFSSPQALGVHRRHRHGHRRIPGAAATCALCQAEVRADGMARHRREVHSEAPWSPTAQVPPTPVVLKHGEEWFLCDRCPERFRDPLALVEHRASHAPADRGKPVGRPSIQAAAIAGKVIA